MKTSSKRLISLLVVVMMVVSLMPIQAFAIETDTETTDHQHTEEVIQFVETELVKESKSVMDEILDKYLGARIMSREDVEEFVWNMDEDALYSAWDEVQAYGELVEPMSDEETALMLAYESTPTFGYFYETLNEIFNPSFSFFAATGTHTPTTNVTVGVSGASDNSMSSGAVTVTAKGSAGILGYGASAKTATITVYNESDATAALSFDWTATSVNELKIDGTLYTGTSGSFSKVLDAGASFVITITTAKNSTVNTLVMSNFALAAVSDESDVTFAFDNTLGGVTAGGVAIEAGSSGTISKDGIELKATPNSGVTFIGWIDTADNSILSRDATFTLKPANDMTVKAVFAATAPWFLVNGNSLYEGLDAAMTAVASVANKTVVLMNNATLPAGNYTIPAGVTLLIPFDDAHTLYTTEPVAENISYAVPTVYRTMTMASGANITVNGAISLSAKQTASGGLSAPIGKVSMIKMESDSSITVNSGANLYVWGSNAVYYF